MKQILSRWFCFVFLAAGPAFAEEVIINEIMYHPSSENVAEEYIELYNRGTNTVNLQGWRFSKGISFTFTNNTFLAPGGYLVVAAHVPIFQGKYPGVANVVGGWQGVLGNSGEEIELENAAGVNEESVTYADEGDWARRYRAIPNRTTYGWDWLAEHDGLGKSLERINPALPNDSGQNWASSGPLHGTPGAPNSVRSSNVAPLILEAVHAPAIPRSSEAVTVTARIVDENPASISAAVLYRTLNNSYASAPMLDDGSHNDGLAGDGVFGAILPPQSDGTVVEFYLQANDGVNTRTWPAVALSEAGTPVQTANLHYQVDESVYGGGQPFYRIIMTEAERAIFQGIDRQSDAQMNATFITVDGTSTQVRYNVGVRIRGAGSRGRTPTNLRVNIPTDRTWNGLSEINLNTQFTHAQMVGAALALRSGLPASDARLIQVRVNGVNLANSGSPQFGSYVFVEPINGEFAENHFPDDGGGNVYRASTSAWSADLSHHGTNAATYISRGYAKTSNGSENDWSDLTNLTYVLTNAPDATYIQQLRQVVNVEEWLTYFAACSLLEYSETSLANGRGDDYAMYRGLIDQRFQILAHDFDTVLGQGDTAGNTNESIFIATRLPAIDRFLKHPEIAPLYFRELKRLADTVFSPEQLNPLLDQYLTGFVPALTITAMKDFTLNRRANVLSQIPMELTVRSSLPVVNGYHYTANSTTLLGGLANVIETRSIRVNGTVANYTGWQGNWGLPGVALNPGLNRILVQAFNEAGGEVGRSTIEIFYDDGSVANVSGTISSTTTWTAAGGPYLVTGNVTVPAGVTLTIEAGTTVMFAQNATLTVDWRLVAEGTETRRIWFTRAPGSGTTWGGLRFNNTVQDNRITYADIDFANTGDPITVVNSTLLLDHIIWRGTTRTIIELNNSSLIVRNSVFPTIHNDETIHGSGMRTGGYVIVENNYFGGTTGVSDMIDFTGGKRPGSILQILSNVFDGGSDDALDLDATDAHIEGNIFTRIHKNNLGNSRSSAIAADTNSQVTVVRNIFYDLDHAVLLQNGAFLTAHNNTFVNCAIAAISFDETNRNVNPGAGALLDGNIFWNNAAAFENLYFNHPVNANTDLTVNRSLVQGTNWPGVGNLNADPRFVNLDTNTITYLTVRDNLRLGAGSPAMGSGPNGLDMGAMVPAGASISGEPASPTSMIGATLRVGGPGITHYRYRINSGAYAAETSISNSIVLNALTNGSYTISVIGKNSAGVWQALSNATVSRTWTVNSGFARLVLNEVLARNNATLAVDGAYPDLVELYNDGAQAMDLSGLGITDDPSNKFKFSFPAGTTLGARQYLILYADDDTGGTGLRLGFGLNQLGDSLYLYHRPANGGALLDSVHFGPQLPDLSIGRLGDGSWALTQPTFGSANRLERVGDPTRLKINEWFTDGRTIFLEDFVELFNADPLPVPLGGLYLTDHPIGAPRQHQIAPLSFMAGFGHLAFIADGETAKGADHLNFKLSPDQGAIALLTTNLDLIDCVLYGPQTTDISEGRRPSGADRFSFFGAPNGTQPTPGAPNPGLGGLTTLSNLVVNLMPLATVWRYNQPGFDLGTAWRAPGYNDSLWPSGLALLGDDDDLPSSTFETPLTVASSNLTFYFRTTFVVNTNLNGYTLIASTYLDDGAVVYLNGVEALRVRMPAGPVDFSTRATTSVDNFSLEGFILSSASLQPGVNVLAVEVHQQSSGSSDVAWGMALSASRTITNVTPRTLVLNEVMANNLSVTAPGATNVTDWVDLYNASATNINLSDMSLSDDLADPRRWVFPAGVSLPPGAYLTVLFDSGRPASTSNVSPLNTGFGLSAGGDTVYLYDAPANGGSQFDGVTFGLQAADHSIGRIPNGTGPWSLNLPTPGSVNISSALGPVGTLKLNEWMASPAGNNDDYFEIYNPSPQPVALSGLYLTDNLSNQTQHEIPPLSFIGVGGNGFALFVADGAPAEGADHVGFRLSAGGESLGIFTAAGVAIDSLTFGAQQNGVSEGRFPDGSAVVVPFVGTPTPGQSNLRAITEVQINEVLSHTDPPLEDAIELHNPTPGSVDISGWYLSDKKNDPRKFRIPDGTVLPPGGYAVFYEYQFNASPDVAERFALNSSEGDEVYLFTADAAGSLTGYRTSVKFSAAASGVSFGRYQTSVAVDFVAQSQRTFGMDNPASTNEFRLGGGLANAYPLVGPIVINEIMYHPPDLGTNDNTLDEFIELRNISAAAVSLFHPNYPTNTWRLRDAVDFEFPPNISLPAGGYLLVVSFDPATNATVLADFRARHAVPAGVPIFGPFRGMLANGDENVELYKPDAPQAPGLPDAGFVPYVLADQVQYADSSPWPSAADGATNYVSLQRRNGAAYGNDPINWLAGLGTAGRATGPAVIELPAITQQPLDRTVAPGSVATFTVSASGAPTLRYQWQRNGVDISGATAPSLPLSNVQLAASGRYTVLVANSAGAVLSAAAVLTVQAPPMITRQPQHRALPIGATAAFTVAAQGAPTLSFQWRKDGVNLPGATGPALLVTDVQMSKEGNYTVAITNAFGAVTSSVASLMIISPPVIESQPQSRSVFVGASVTFSVGAVGSAPLRYQWRFNNAIIPDATSSVLTLNNVQLASAGNYSVVVTNGFGAASSALAILEVTVPPVVTVVATDRLAREGGDAGEFTVTRTGSISTSLTVPFSVGGSAMPDNDYVRITSPLVIPAGSSSHKIAVTPVNDSALEGDETVVITLAGTAEYVVGSPANATVTIQDDDNPAPSITLTNPADGTFFAEPGNIALGAAASDVGGSIAKVEFFYNETNKIGEATASPYLFTWTNAPGGQHVLTAVATDNLGSTTVSPEVDITVNFLPAVVITVPTNSARFTAPANIAISATATDGDGTIAQVEFYSGANLIGSDSVPPYGTVFSNVPVGTYTLTARVIDNHGAVVTSQPVLVVVNPAPAGFSDSFATRGVMTGYTNYVTGNSAAYTHEAGEPRHHENGSGSGTRSAWLTWTAPAAGACVMNTLGTSFDTVLVVYTGASVSNLVKVASNDDASPTTFQSQVTFNAVAGATYQIVVDGYSPGVGGGIVFRMNLQDSSPPTIAVHPQAQVANPGSNVTFSVTASGGSSLSYQWRFNGGVIPGATGGTLTRHGVQHLDGGNYTVSVANGAGSVNSQAAELVVRPVVVRSHINPSGLLQLTVNGTPGRSYALEVTTNWVNWTVLTSMTHSAVEAQFTDPTPLGAGFRVYRLRLLTP